MEPGRTFEIVLADVIDATPEAAGEVFDRLLADPAAPFEEARRWWDAELEACFTPGNDRFSGWLPRLETSSDTLWRLYFQGMLGLVYFKREMPRVGRVYTTLMPRYWTTLTWIWDYQLGSVGHALLDPRVMLRCLERWMSEDVHTFMATEWMSGRPVGPWYAVNDHAMLRIVRDYVRWTGYVDWLGECVESTDGVRRAVLDRVRSYARSWESFRTQTGLADYGSMSNLLECVKAYRHEVAGLNVANVFNLRVAGELLEAAGHGDEARVFRDAAGWLLERVQALYVEGEGCWATRHPGDRLVPVRHCFDLLTVLNAIPEDLSGTQRDEMARFFESELRTETWMHALSPRDRDALFDIRPDHQWTGAYAAWPAETAAGLYRIGRTDLAESWLHGLARSTAQGPTGQAHFADGVVTPLAGGARKAPSEFPYLTDWGCTAGAAWIRLVIESVFGVEAPVQGTLRATPSLGTLDPDARLVNLRYQGVLHTVDATGARPQRDAE